MSEEAKEYARCAADGWHFISNYVYILDPALGVVKFEPWEHLHDFFNLIIANDRVIILKARQLGFSWLLCAMALWYALFKPGANILMFSRRQTEAIAMKNRAKFIWRNLPLWMQQPIDKDNDELLTFPDMDSKIQSFPATEGSGRMESSTLVIMDEFADMPYAREVYTAVLPTVEFGKLVGVSTAKGRKNLFADLYTRAKARLNTFTASFTPYTARPGRTAEWKEQQTKDMPNPNLANQEYPLTEDEAFLAAGSCLFDLDALAAMSLYDPIRRLGPCEIYVEYDETHDYVAGVDTALGGVGGDNAVLQIIDTTAGEQVAKLRSNIPIEEFSTWSHELLSQYNNPFIIPEEQPQGRLFVKILLDLKYPRHRIYHRSKNVPCFHTGNSNRTDILSRLAVGIRTATLKFHSAETVEEMRGFGYNDEKNKYEATSGYDDEVMSSAFGWFAVTTRPRPMTDFTPRPFTPASKSGVVSPTKINWAKKNPFEGLVAETCNHCNGERVVETDHGKHTCAQCRGAGAVLRRVRVT